MINMHIAVLMPDVDYFFSFFSSVKEYKHVPFAVILIKGDCVSLSVRQSVYCCVGTGMYSGVDTLMNYFNLP